MDSDPDIRLLKKADQDEWDKAFRWLMPNAEQVSRNVLGQKLQDQIKDNAIESIEAVIDKIKGLNRITEVRAMVIKIAHNKGVDKLRKHYSLKKGAGNVVSLNEEEGLQDIPDSNAESLDSKYVNEDTIVKLEKLMKILSEKEKKCLISQYLHGKSHKEISQNHDIPIGSIGVTVSRAMKKMRDQL